ncbi:MAG: hypothetical protein HUU16_00140 [Candidatus Omnitrophica bacterium]|nr:hypothetical protein [Candidatus Omnitrophota bacterium]
MRHLVIVSLIVLVANAGAQNPTPTPHPLGAFGENPLKANRAKWLEFRNLVRDVIALNQDILIEELWKTALGAPIPSATTEAYDYNLAQENRWLSPSRADSFSQRLYLRLARESVGKGRGARPEVWNNYLANRAANAPATYPKVEARVNAIRTPTFQDE